MQSTRFSIDNNDDASTATRRIGGRHPNVATALWKAHKRRPRGGKAWMRLSPAVVNKIDMITSSSTCLADWERTTPHFIANRFPVLAYECTFQYLKVAETATLRKRNVEEERQQRHIKFQCPWSLSSSPENLPAFISFYRGLRRDVVPSRGSFGTLLDCQHCMELSHQESPCFNDMENARVGPCGIGVT